MRQTKGSIVNINDILRELGVEDPDAFVREHGDHIRAALKNVVDTVAYEAKPRTEETSWERRERADRENHEARLAEMRRLWDRQKRW